MIVEPGVFLPESVCRFGRWLEELARADCRRNGWSMDHELAEHLWEMGEVADQYRSRYQPTPEPGTEATINIDMGVEDLAARLGVTGSYIRRLARTEVLPGRRVGGRWIFGADAIEAFEKERAS
jgi:excisionase family DNA binding protein